MNIKIYQSYYLKSQKQGLEPEFIPFDNTANEKPEHREYHIWKKLYEEQDKNTFWGMVSPKFKSKTNITGKQFIDFIEANPGWDCYFVNPAIANESIFLNVWQQGEFYHPGITQLANELLQKSGYDDVDVNSIVMDSRIMMFSSFIVADSRFWDEMMRLVNRIFEIAEEDSDFNYRMFTPGLADYKIDPTMSMFPFVVERLTSTIIALKDLKACPYRYHADDETLHIKYIPYINDLVQLSKLKIAINNYLDEDLVKVWDYYRKQLLKEKGNVLTLE